MTNAFNSIDKISAGYNPIESFNQVLNNDVNIANNNQDAFNTGFDELLNSQIERVGSNTPIEGGIQLISDFGIPKVDSTSNSSPIGNLVNQVGGSFGSAMNSLNQAQINSQNAVETFAAGGDISVHEVMIASEKANLSMNMAIQLRNKIVSAYSEINNIRL